MFSSVEFLRIAACITKNAMAYQEGCADGKAIVQFNNSRIKLIEIETSITGAKVKDYV